MPSSGVSSYHITAFRPLIFLQDHVPYPRDRFEPIMAALRSLKKHNLYQVTLVPLSLAIEKKFPNALVRFGFINIEAYVSQARDAGLIITGVDPKGRTWVSLADNIDTHGSVSYS